MESCASVVPTPGRFSTGTKGHDALLASLSCQIDRVLQPLLPQGSSCALLEFPDYANVGDSAIWMGERAWLRRQEVTVLYTCARTEYSRQELTKRLGPDGTILLQGGGNFGDLWPVTQQFHEQVIRDFPDRPIIQLPQTIHFTKTANLKRARQVLNGHPNLTLLLRDQHSLEIARSEFPRARSLLCPDMTFALGPLARPVRPSCETLWLRRSDQEARGKLPSINGHDVQLADWAEEPPSMLRTLRSAVRRQIQEHPRRLQRFAGWLCATHDGMARQRLMRGCRVLSQGRLVITDRLHGHILSLLMGIPHVLLDNSYGKVRRFYEAWTKEFESVRWADVPAQALEQAVLLTGRDSG